MAYNIMHNTGRFEHGLHEWISKTQVQQTWINFKTHFTQAHKQLKQLGALTVGDTIPYQQANALQQMVFSAVEDAVHQLQLVPTPEYTPTETPTASPPTEETQPPVQQANATTTDQLVPLLQSMQKMMKLMQTNMANMQGNGTNIKPTKPTYPARKMQYCWTHGYCYHDGKSCTRKAQGHKDEATFEKRMNGSTKGMNRYKKN